MTFKDAFFCAVVCFLGFFVWPQSSRAQASEPVFDSLPVWPLCGRISEDPPAGWTPNDGCPVERWGDPEYSDFPLSTSYGPRLLSSGNDRYDFHRGIDISTPEGTPFFALADGVVRIAGNDSGYSDPLIRLRHYRPGSWGSCKPDGCYHTHYHHISGWVVSEGEVVVKGQLLGYTGASGNGYEHIHLEVRNAPPFDPYSTWSRDAVHPLRVLSYYDAPETTQVSILSVDTGDPLNPVVTVEVLQVAGAKTWDVNRTEVEVYDNSTGASVFQPGAVLDENGYSVNPPWFDFELRNFQYTHKNSSSIPWSSFDNCPYGDDHGRSYDASLHMDQQDPEDFQAGLFNGIRAAITKYSNPAKDYRLTLRFDELVGTADPADLCISVRVANAFGSYTTPVTWNCTF